MDYLARHEIGLAPSRDELSDYDELVILFVSGQRNALRKEDAVPEDEVEFREEAEPSEMDVSDSDLQKIVRQRKR
tara:strand:- start:867 stop:1091 length:225 start_codon:yes stop_codon:yes gene_type:complete